MDRRALLRRAGAIASVASVSGCIGVDDVTGLTPGRGGSETRVPPVPDFPMVEDPPDAVYVPTHRESMRMLAPISAGEYTLAPMLSYPHPFWIVSGTETERVEPDGSSGVHLMCTLWDDETGVVLPVDSGVQLRVLRDGDPVGSPRAPWPMISQGMGFHFGDNVALDGDGTYTVEVTLPPCSVRKTGSLEGRFAETETASFEFVYDEHFRREVVDGVEYLDETYWGRRGALEPMGYGDRNGRDDLDGHDEHSHDEHSHDEHRNVPYSTLPAGEDYPGTQLEEERSGDAVFVTTLLDAGSRFVGGDGRYLLVSPRTPYNRVPLADMALSVTIEREGTTIADDALTQTIDGELGLHYGIELDGIARDDSVTISVESPPQVARHQGYETAFLDMSQIELTVPDGV